MNFAYWLAILATLLNGLITGASLDQSIKQLPARRKIGPLAFTKYSQAADLGNGIYFYGILGIGSAVVTIGAAIAAFAGGATGINTTALYVAAVFSLLHSFTTTQAAPLNHSQKKIETDELALTELFNRFERWQTARCILQVITFAASILAIAG